MRESDDGRPVPEDRAVSDRCDPAVIAIRTRFSYRATPTEEASNQRPRVSAYHSEITDIGEFASPAAEYNTVGDVIQRMLRAFGDDADLEVVVRRRTTTVSHQTQHSTTR